VASGKIGQETGEHIAGASPSAAARGRKRVVSGMRPTGPLHIGHFFGALSNWLKLQEEYDCFFFVADWHALTTHYADTSLVAANTLQVAMDWLSVGIDPAKATLFVQSFVPEHAELHLLLSMITPLGWLERVPTYKEQIENLRDKDLGTYGFLGYPLLQTADIVIYDADLVPVGEDQVPHVELSREVVRRFNTAFGDFDWTREGAIRLSGMADHTPPPSGHEEWFEDVAGKKSLESWLRSLALDHRLSLLANAGMEIEHVLHEPDAMLTETPRLPGTDGRRMAKSYGNAISLSESLDSIRGKVRNMMTDPARVRRTDPGNPDVCPVFSYHKLFSDAGTIDLVNRDCRTAAIGCVDCKRMMGDGLIRWIEPVQARRHEYEANPSRVWDILDSGSKTAGVIAQQTMGRVRNAVFHWDDTREKAGAPLPKINAGVPGGGE
jgi:tryptophanyl-tRNA synthetase